MARVKAKTSAVVSRQVPEFVREDHPEFVSFLEAYYEWLDENYNSKKIDNIMQLDESVDEFVDHFAEQFMQFVPKSILADRNLVMRYAKDLYESKGTPKSFDLLFRIMFNEEPQEIYYPKVDILKSSDGKWEENLIIRGFDVQGDSFSLIGQTISQPNPETGLTETYGLVESVIKYNVGIEEITEINLSRNGLFGEFVYGLPIYGENNVDQTVVKIEPISFINGVDIITSGSYYENGDPVYVAEQNPEGVDFRATVQTVSSGSIEGVEIVDGGFGHYVKQPIVFDNTDAGFEGSDRVDSAKAEVEDIVTGGFVLEDYIRFSANSNFVTGQRINYAGRQYLVENDGLTSSDGPTHINGSKLNGEVNLKYVGKSDKRILVEGDYASTEETSLDLEYRRVYRTNTGDEYGDYDLLANEVVVETGPIKTVRLIYGGKHYNRLPRVLPITDNVDTITTEEGSNVVTVTTVLAHEMQPGEKFVLTGTINQIADGTYSVFEVLNQKTITFRSETIFSNGGSLTLPNRKQYLHSEKTVTDNLLRKVSTAVIIPTSSTIGRANTISISNFGYFYNNARLTLPQKLVVRDFSTNFVFGEEVTMDPQIFSTERGDLFQLESGESFLLEQQYTPSAIVKEYDIEKGTLNLINSSGLSNLLAENGDSLVTETNNNFSNENSHTYIKNAVVRGSLSNATAKIVDVSNAILKESLGSFGETSGKFLNSDGKVSDGAKKIQDSYFYQDFSYVLRVGASVSKYRDAVKKLLHPAGLAMFGEVNLVTAVAALIDQLKQRNAVLTNIVDIQTKASALAVGNWQEETYRVAMDNQDRFDVLEMEGGEFYRFITEDGINTLSTEDGKTLIDELSSPDGRILLKEDGYGFLKDEQTSTFFPENLLGETYNFFRLEEDNLHVKSRNPDVRKEMWVIRLEDFLPSSLEADIPLVLEDGSGDIILEDGFRFLSEQQEIKSAPSIRVLQSEMLPPVIIPEMPLNTIHLLEMSPEVFKENVFGIYTKTSMEHQLGYFDLEDDTGILLAENGNKLFANGDTILVAEEAARNVTIESQPMNVELDHLLLENGYQLLRQPDYPDGFTRLAVIDAYTAGTIDFTATVFNYGITSPPFVGHRVNIGPKVTLNNDWDFEGGTVTNVSDDGSQTTFTVRMDSSLTESRPETDSVALAWEMPSSKLTMDNQSQAVFGTNFRTQVLPVKTLNTTTNQVEVYSSKFTTQIRPSFRQLGSNVSFVEKRKFTFPPYVFDGTSKGSLQVNPGTVPPNTKMWFNHGADATVDPPIDGLLRKDTSIIGVKIGDIIENDGRLYIIENLTGTSPYTIRDQEPSGQEFKNMLSWTTGESRTYEDVTFRYYGPRAEKRDLVVYDQNYDVVVTAPYGGYGVDGDAVIQVYDNTDKSWRYLFENARVGDTGYVEYLTGQTPTKRYFTINVINDDAGGSIYILADNISEGTISWNNQVTLFGTLPGTEVIVDGEDNSFLFRKQNNGEAYIEQGNTSYGWYAHLANVQPGDTGEIVSNGETYPFTVLNWDSSTLFYIDAPTMPILSYLGGAGTIIRLFGKEESDFNRSWNKQYPDPNRDYWSDDYILNEVGDNLILESGADILSEVEDDGSNLQIKDFGDISVYDVINRRYKKANFAVGAYVDILKSA